MKAGAASQAAAIAPRTKMEHKILEEARLADCCGKRYETAARVAEKNLLLAW